MGFCPPFFNCWFFSNYFESISIASVTLIFSIPAEARTALKYCYHMGLHPPFFKYFFSNYLLNFSITSQIPSKRGQRLNFIHNIPLLPLNVRASKPITAFKISTKASPALEFIIFVIFDVRRRRVKKKD